MKRCLLSLLWLSLCLTLNAQTGYTCRYWFDENHAASETIQFSDSLTQVELNVQDLSEGIHSMYIIVKDTSQTWSAPQSYMFIKLADTLTSGTGGALTYHCWFDEDYSTKQSGTLGNGHILLDVQNLAEGIHTVSVMLEGSTYSVPQSYMFIKLADTLTSGTGGALAYHCWFDEDYSTKQSGTLGNGHILLDVQNLAYGIHTVNVQLEGISRSVSQSYLFFRAPKMMKYEYWLNGDFENRMTRELTQISDTLSLVALLPVDTLPIRSSCFQFQPNGDNPIIYAKNDIRFRFWTTDLRFTDTLAYFIDMNVSDTVTADTIERNTTKIIPLPIDNNIHWFKLYAEVGDSLLFKTDQECTIQLFQPSGDNVFSNSGSKALQWDGCHVREDGVYYLAVHDGIVGSSSNVSVSYRHIHKYAVFDYDVNIVGNGGPSNINFNGNGFDSLVAIYFINAQNDTITSLPIWHERNTYTSATFDFNGADTGVYRAVFAFVDENIIINNAIRVEQAKDVILVSDVTYPSSFLRNNTVTYTVTITNTGNMTAYNVPIYIYMETPTGGSISHLRLEGLNLPSLSDCMDLSSMSDNEITQMRKVSDEIGDKHYFISSQTTDELTGQSIDGLGGYFVISLAPYETKTIEIKGNPSRDVYVGVTVPDTISTTDSGNGHTSRDWFCCVKDKIECVLSAISSTSDIAATITGIVAPGTPASLISSAVNCAISLINEEYSVISDRLCPSSETSGFNNFRSATSLVGTVIGCLSSIVNFTPDGIKGLNNVLTVSNIVTEGINCVRAFSQKTSDCLPQQSKGGKSNMVTSYDPNEIYGYTAESGSLAVSKEQEELYYAIQFENDSTMASANARKVYVQDTLDANIFDLSSFAATYVTIGSQEILIDGNKQFVRTLDMRPEINLIAQVELSFDSVQGIALWTFTSLDPMTMEETTDSTLGFLPININGNGIGEVGFTIRRKANLADSSLITNYATIIFDHNEPVVTSTWVNILDTVSPISSIDSVIVADSIAVLNISTSDNLSGVWRYDVYAQYGTNSEWNKVAENIPADSAFVKVQIHDGLNTGFVSIAIDSAGNVEQKPMLRATDIFTMHVITNTNDIHGAVHGGGNYDYNSTVTLTVMPNACSSFVSWNDGNTDNPRTITVISDTTFTAMFESIDYSREITAAICEGSTYTENGFNVSEAGTYTQNLQTINGCDSTVTLNLTVNPVETTNLSASICEGTTYTENGFNASEAGTYTQNLQTINGCDSIVTLTLAVNPVANTNLTAAICEGTTYTENGFNVSEAGTYTQNLQTVNGCDSIVILNLTVNPVANTNLTAAICEGSSYTENGFNVSEAGTYTQTLQTVNGCDSIVTLNLTINPVESTTLSAAICEGTSYTENGFNVSEAGSYTQNLQTVNGCDSVVTLTLTVNPVANTNLTAAICEGTTYTENGFNASEAGTYTQNLQTINGCDSIVTLNLTISTVINNDITAAICEGSVYTENGFNASEAGTYTQTLQTVNGCDSIVTLTLTVNPTYNITIDASINEGETYEENGFSESEAGTYVHTLQAVNGCDSVITLNLTVNSSLNDVVANAIEVSLYPNPANAYTTLKVEGLKEQTPVYLFDIQGRKLKEYIMNIGQETLQIDLGDLPKGVYTITIGNTTKKLIVE